MKKIKLTYFKKSSNKPMYLYFSKIEDLHNWVELKTDENSKENDRVFLFTYNDINSDDSSNSECFVTERIGLIADLLKQNYFFGFDLLSDFHLHEYDSFEDAYLVARDMKEGNALCY